MMGKEAIERAFGRSFAHRYNIHRTRRNFPNDGIDTFDHMAEVGVAIVDRVVKVELGGTIDREQDAWRIPASSTMAR